MQTVIESVERHALVVATASQVKSHAGHTDRSDHYNRCRALDRAHPVRYKQRMWCAIRKLPQPAALALWIGGALSPLASYASAAPTTLTDASSTTAINSLQQAATQATADDQFSGALLIAKGDRILFQSAYGLADREHHLANTLDTKFRFGSMGKMFTAVAVMQLVHSGKINLQAALGTYLPDYPNADVKRVTVEQLLTHTGGTGDFFGPEFLAQRARMREHKDYIALLGSRGLAFTPGSQFQYSNYGYILLGRIVEVVSGESYYDYVQHHIFQPAGMTSTGYTPEDQSEPNRAIGYTRRTQPALMIQPPPAGGGQSGAMLPPLPPLGPPQNADAASSQTPWRSIADNMDIRGTAAGGGFSTVGDLLRFATALLNHQLLDEATTTLLLTGKVDTARPGIRYAYGFEDDHSVSGVRRVGHGGGSDGMNGWLGIFPDSGYIVIGLANLDPPAAEKLTSLAVKQLPLAAGT